MANIERFFEDGVCHLRIRHGFDAGDADDVGDADGFRRWFVPMVNKIELVMPVAVHGVPFCFLPDAFELVVDDLDGVRLKPCRDCSLKSVCSGFPAWFTTSGMGARWSVFTPNPQPQTPNPVDVVHFQPSLREVGVELNRSCLFRCDFCFMPKSDGLGVMQKDDALALIDLLVKRNVRAVRFFGGDPVLRSDFVEILGYAKKKGLFTIVNTNGVFSDQVSRDIVPKLSDLLVISLHGHDEESQGALTGRPDLFRPVLASIQRIAALYPDKLMVSTLVTRRFLENRDRYFVILSRLGVRRWSLNRQISPPAQRYRSPQSQNGLSPPSADIKPFCFVDLAKWASGLVSNAKMRIVLNDLPHCLVEKEHRFLIDHNVQTGSMARIFCDADGFFRTSPSYSLGLGRDLDFAWRNNPMKWSADPPVPKECLSCKVLMRCLGGSRSMAYLSTGDVRGRDPFMVGPI